MTENNQNKPTAPEIEAAWHQALVKMIGPERAVGVITLEAIMRAGYTPPAARRMVDSPAMTVQMRLASQKHGGPKPQE